jgi:pilus assembly protein CpaE
LHTGAAEYLDEAILEAELSGALARFKARAAVISSQQTAGWVISVLAASGGSGSSTIAANISATFAQQLGQCGLVDLRLSAGDLTSMLDLQPTHTIADLCDHLSRLDQSMFDQFFVRHASGVALLAAPSRFADIPRVTAKGVRQTLAMARVRFPYVVVDLNDAFGSEQVEALWQSDVIVLMLRLDYTSVRNTRRALENLGHLGIDMGRVKVVVNGYGERKQLTVAQAEEALRVKIAHLVPSDPASINQAINRGVPAVLCCPSGKASKSLRRLAADLNGHSRKPVEMEVAK